MRKFKRKKKFFQIFDWLYKLIKMVYFQLRYVKSSSIPWWEKFVFDTFQHFRQKQTCIHMKLKYICTLRSICECNLRLFNTIFTNENFRYDLHLREA